MARTVLTPLRNRRELKEEDASQPEALADTRLRFSRSLEPPSVPFVPSDSESTQDSFDMRLCGRQAWLLRQREKSLDSEKERVAVEKKSQPAPPSHTHGRRLSATSNPDITQQQTHIESEPIAALQRHISDKQPHCLLWKLPLELREEIFSLVLGADSTLHLISRTKRVGHWRCPGKSQNSVNGKRSQQDWRLDTFTSDCHCGTVVVNATYLTIEEIRSRIKISHIELALLQTCKRAYREGIHLLYSRPVFDFDHAETLNWFARTVRPQRLAAITKLNISLREAVMFWEIPYDQQRPFRVIAPKRRVARNDGDLLRYWDPAWRTILCDMTNLKHLTVTLVGNNSESRFDDHEYTEPVLKPLLELRGLLTFQLRLRGESSLYGNSEAARLKSLTERSDTLRMILEKATSERTGTKRKAEDLEWGPPPARKRRRKAKNMYRY
ncbi:hypothetical protein N0V90_005872 [Kalmusia sp. IMI 367209]|nr:hypothetical protein N0V90_005872 [Kalmusia sp. IMI 367209]